MVAAKTKCDRLFRKFSDRTFIMDEESYFTLTLHFNYNDRYYTNDLSTIQPIIKFITKAKFEKKIFVWIAIGPKGLSHPFIRMSEFVVNGQRPTTFEQVHLPLFNILYP